MKNINTHRARKPIVVNKLTVCLLILLSTASALKLYAQQELVSFKVSMPNPNNHYYHVKIVCTGFSCLESRFECPGYNNRNKGCKCYF